ncbi:MAG TPA: hypothetical protein VK878_08185 [Candidatus Deferrimicrobiaceae bacterium]|nr:hypothetical protein [Candidatus Deferrimicrobiaceae bacterium]
MTTMTPGAYLRLGEDVLAQVTGYATPCLSLTTGDPVQLLTEDEALTLIGPR